MLYQSRYILLFTEDSAHENRSRRFEERWQLIAEHLVKWEGFSVNKIYLDFCPLGLGA